MIFESKKIIDERVHNYRLMENTMRKLVLDSVGKNLVVNEEIMIDKRTGEVLGREVNYACYKDKFS